MKTLLIIVIVFAIAVLGYLFHQGRLSRDGKPLGTVDGKLVACPSTPNCVTSEGHERVDTVPENSVAPLMISPAVNVMDRLKSAVVAMGGEIVAESDAYLAATFTSSVFGFVDDLELKIDNTSNDDSAKIHVRSASRVGRSDLGANRKRVEALRDRLSGG